MKRIILIALFIIGFSFMVKGQYTKIFDFGKAPNGNSPRGELVSDGTFLYGMTNSGGMNLKGVIFKIKADGTAYSMLHEFGSGTDGALPYGSLLIDGPFLYGMTKSGGAYGYGTVFKIHPDSTSYSTIYSFKSATDGANPYGSLVSDGTFLYGMTQAGGISNFGTIFKIKQDGSGYSKLLDFTGNNGYNPYGSLLYEGGILYGMTYYGGTGTCNFVVGCGVIFKIKTDGTGYSKLYDFSNTDGHNPFGSLISDGTFLYGMTSAGGSGGFYDLGVIFKIKTDGTGYSNIYDFKMPTGDEPHGSLIHVGNILYGMTYNHGLYAGGTMFRINTDGTGFFNLFIFSNQMFNNTQYLDGYFPYGALLSEGGILYGMANQGGQNNLGVIFKYDIGTDINELNTKSDFTIFPSPCSGKFNLTSSNVQGFSNCNEVTIYNLLGEKVFIGSHFTNSSSIEIDLSKSTKGIYFITILSNDRTKIYNSKIVLQ